MHLKVNLHCIERSAVTEENSSCKKAEGGKNPRKKPTVDLRTHRDSVGIHHVGDLPRNQLCCVGFACKHVFCSCFHFSFNHGIVGLVHHPLCEKPPGLASLILLAIYPTCCLCFHLSPDVWSSCHVSLVSAFKSGPVK